MKKLLLILLIIAFFGCDTWEEQQTKPLNDDRFNGKFIYLYEYKALDGINETTERLEFTFDKTNQAQWYHSYRSYYSNRGWNTWSNYCPVKFEISNGTYRITKWSVDEKLEGSFTDWQPYSFSDDGNTLVLQNYDFELTSKYNYTLKKE
jgi:hypothetical protein